MNECKASSGIPNATEITVMQIIGCILVILGHSYPFVLPIPFFLNQLRVFIYCFHMPIFVWCSGFLLSFTRQKEKYTLFGFALRRAKRLLIPYFGLSVMGIMPKLLFSAYLNDNFKLNFDSLLRSFIIPRNNIWGHFWFLPMIFILGLLGYVLTTVLDVIDRHIKIQKLIRFCIVFVAFLLSFLKIPYCEWFGINDVLSYLWIYITGIYAGEKSHRMTLRLTGGGVLLVISVLLNIYNTSIGRRVQLIDKIIAILMIYAVWLICQFISDHYHISRGSIVSQTYTIFILSWPCQLAAEIITERIFHMPIYIVMPLMFAAGVIGPIGIISILNFIDKKTNKKNLSLLLGR